MARRQAGFLGFAGLELAVLAAYGALLCLMLTHYLPWEDEGRAWMDARFFGFFHLLLHVLRYEGHPAIWYVILWPLAHLHMPFQYINWLSALCGFAGVCFLVRKAPFPFYLRALLPFGFTLAYEYAIVARGYCLFPLFGFMVADEFRQPARRPLRMAVCLALLANLSLHGAFVALVFVAAYAWDLRRERRAAGEPFWSAPRLALGAGVFAASIMFLLVVLWPARDLQPEVPAHVGRFIRRIAPAAYHPATHHPALLRISAPAAATPAPQPSGQNLGLGILSLRERLDMIFLYPVAAFAPLALLFEGLVCALVWRRGKPILLLAPLLVAAFLMTVYLRLWHAGLMWVLAIMLLWAVWDQRGTLRQRNLQSATAVVFALVSLLQIPWTVAAVRFDRHHATYPAREAAAFVAALPPGTRVDGFDHSFTLLPYFVENPFHMESDVLNVGAVLADSPDVILYRNTTVADDQFAQLLAAGYRHTHNFCGTPFFPNQRLTTLCFVVLQR